MHAGMTESPLSSPNDSPISGDLGHRFMGKCPIKLQSPTFGRVEDNPDPLLYLEKCKDFLSINPLTDEELTVTFRNVLYSTARDWWDITLTQVMSHQSLAATLLGRLSVQIPISFSARGLWKWADRKAFNVLCAAVGNRTLLKKLLWNSSSGISIQSSQLQGRVNTVVPGGMTFLFSNRSFFSPVDVQDNQTQYPTDLVGS